MKIYDLLVSPNSTLRDAMTRMTYNRKGLVFVCDESRRLQGVLSDGDARRHLLGDVLLSTPVNKIMNTHPLVATSIEQAQQVLQRFGSVAVPIVNENKVIDSIIILENGAALTLKIDEAGETIAAVDTHRAVAIIPARGGSKRIKKKNLQMLGGVSLLERTIRCAQACKNIGEIIVSTDDPAIAEAARGCGVQVPWLRPENLAEDGTPTFDVVAHAVRWLAHRHTPMTDYCVLLEPTAPMRRSSDVDGAIERLIESGADSVVAVCEVPHVFHPDEALRIDNDRLLPYLASTPSLDQRRLRGAQSPSYIMSGVVYAFTAQCVLEKNSLFGQTVLPFITPWQEYVDIDTVEDLNRAEKFLRF